MAMEIINNYSSHAENYADTTKRSNSNAVTEGRINTATNSRDNVQQYYEQLCKKFSRINFNTSGGITSSSKNNIVLNLSNDCLKKMAGDPDFAKKMFAKAKSDGIEIQGFSVRINADGSMQCSCSGSTRTSGSNHNASVLNTEKRQMEKRQTEKRQKKELEKEREERNALEEKAKKRAEKKAAERQAEKKEVGDAGNEMSEYTISVTGMDIRAVTEKMIAAVSGISVPTGASFDIKA